MITTVEISTFDEVLKLMTEQEYDDNIQRHRKPLVSGTVNTI